jgi:hypothetical protein
MAHSQKPESCEPRPFCPTITTRLKKSMTGSNLTIQPAHLKTLTNHLHGSVAVSPMITSIAASGEEVKLCPKAERSLLFMQNTP